MPKRTPTHKPLGYGLIYIHTAECKTPEDVGRSRVLLIHAPSYLYRKIVPFSRKKIHDCYYANADQLLCLDLGKRPPNITLLEHANLYAAMFGTSDVECEYAPPRGRQDRIDERDGLITAIREFVEETRGLYHPSFPSIIAEARSLPLPKITDCWIGLDNKVYAYEYALYVDDKDRLLRYGYEDEDSSLGRFIISYLYGRRRSDAVITSQYLERFKYVRKHDAKTHACYMYLEDCLSRWMANRVITLTPPDLALLRDTVKSYLIKKVRGWAKRNPQSQISGGQTAI